jgi:glutamate formiminotransferase
LENCSRLAREFGDRLASECGVPVYLYAESAVSTERRDIDWIREGEFEGLETRICKADRKPDFGLPRAHPTAGATITGARTVMVGFNVNLATKDLTVGKKIARSLHEKKGGLAGVRAMAAEIPQQEMVQIGMSIYDHQKTPIYRVYELLKLEAERYNIAVASSEFNGMIPLEAILAIADYYLRSTNLDENRIIQTAICKRLQDE